MMLRTLPCWLIGHTDPYVITRDGETRFICARCDGELLPRYPLPPAQNASQEVK